MHLQELQEKDARCRQIETLLWTLHVEQFAQWVKDKVNVGVINSYLPYVHSTNTILFLFSTDIF